MTERAAFDKAAAHLLRKLDLPRSAVTLRQTRDRSGMHTIIADLEEDARPKEAPDTIDGYKVKYQPRVVLKIR